MKTFAQKFKEVLDKIQQDQINLKKEVEEIKKQKEE